MFMPKINHPTVSLLLQLLKGETGIEKIPTCLQVIDYFQFNGSFCSVFVLAEPVATVCPFITFRYVKNGEDEFFLAVGVRVF